MGSVHGPDKSSGHKEGAYIFRRQKEYTRIIVDYSKTNTLIYPGYMEPSKTWDQLSNLHPLTDPPESWASPYSRGKQGYLFYSQCNSKDPLPTKIVLNILGPPGDF